MPKPESVSQARGRAASKSPGAAAPLRAHALSLWLRPATPWILLAAITALAYANAGHGVLISDDREFLGGGRFDGLTLRDYLDFFSQSLWEASGAASSLYRPLFLVTLGLEAAVFGAWPAGYHLVNIALHVLATLLIFGFVRQVFLALGQEARSAALASFLAAAVFGVHPVLTEVVNIAFNGSEIYVTAAAAGGLWYLLVNQAERPAKAWGLLALLYFAALLYRESAVSLPALAVLTLWMTHDGPWPARIRACLPALLLVIPLAAYLGLRANALAPDSADPGVAQSLPAAPATAPVQLAKYAPPLRLFAAPEGEAIVEAPETLLDSLGVNLDVSRLSLAVSMWYDALRLMVWPHPLINLREVSTTPFWLALAAQLALLAFALFRWSRGHPAMFLGLAFFYVAILPSSRVISDAVNSPLLLDRMLYLPAAGLAICLAAFLLSLASRVSVRSSVLTIMLVLLVFMPLTWIRNDAWGDELKQLQHDFHYEKRNRQLLSLLIKAHAREGQAGRSLALCDEYRDAVSETPLLLRNCAMVYSAAGLNDKAEDLYLRALEINPSRSWDYFELGRLYVRLDRQEEAAAYFQSAIDREPMEFVREIMRAIMLVEMYPNDPARRLEARGHLERALQLQPRSMHARRLLDQLGG